MSEGFCLTYLECRHRFRRLARAAGARLDAFPIEARGPDGEALAVDVAQLGAAQPARALLVLSGVHGIEGYAGSAIQQQLLSERAPALALPADAALLLVHAVNPWGMAWWRRQNERNVDLNRNGLEPGAPRPANPGYAELHGLLCPEREEDAAPAAFLAAAERLVAERGLAWVKRAITEGQYDHPDGLYYGGWEPEASTRILQGVVGERLAGAAEVLGVDLHTGHGPFASYTLLSHHRVESPEHAWIAARFEPERIEVTAGAPDPATPEKHGQLLRALRREAPRAAWRSFTFELGTVDDVRMILAERAEHWLHRAGDRASAAGEAIAWEHRVCSIPDSPSWREAALAHGARVLDDALRGMLGLAGRGAP